MLTENWNMYSILYIILFSLEIPSPTKKTRLEETSCPSEGNFGMFLNLLQILQYLLNNFLLLSSYSFFLLSAQCKKIFLKYLFSIILNTLKVQLWLFPKHNFLLTLIRLSYLNCTRPRPGPGLTWCSICCGAWRWTWSRTRGGCSGTSPRRPRLHPPDTLLLCMWF